MNRLLRHVLAIPLLIVAACIALLWRPPPLGAGTLEEYKIKAAFLFNFVKFVQWPPEALPEERSTISVCVLGTDPFGETLGAIEDKKLEGKRLVVRRLRSAEEARQCHVVFIAASERDRLGQILGALKGSGTLTVSDMEDFVQRGGMIGFVTTEDRVRFEINVKSARDAGIEISSKLLKLADQVRNGP